MMYNRILTTLQAFLLIRMVSSMPYVDEDEQYDALTNLGLATELPKSFAKKLTIDDPDEEWKIYHEHIFDLKKDLDVPETLAIFHRLEINNKWGAACPIDGRLFLSLAIINPARCTVPELRQYSAYADDALDYPAVDRYFKFFAARQFEYCADAFMKEVDQVYTPLLTKSFKKLDKFRQLLDKAQTERKWWRSGITHDLFERVFGLYLFQAGTTVITEKKTASDADIAHARELSNSTFASDCEVHMRTKELEAMRFRYVEMACLPILGPILENLMDGTDFLKYIKDTVICKFVHKERDEIDFKRVCLELKAHRIKRFRPAYLDVAKPPGPS